MDELHGGVKVAIALVVATFLIGGFAFMINSSSKSNTNLTMPEYNISDTGLKYKILKPGDGSTVKTGDIVIVHYTGKLEDGTVFDSSKGEGKSGEPVEFQIGVGRVIKGWDEGVVGMKVGEERELVIPSRLAYGDNGIPGVIPGGATLIFDVELVSISGNS